MHQKNEFRYPSDGSPLGDEMLILKADGFTPDGMRVALLSNEEKLAFMRGEAGADYAFERGYDEGYEDGKADAEEEVDEE